MEITVNNCKTGEVKTAKPQLHRVHIAVMVSATSPNGARDKVAALITDGHTPVTAAQQDQPVKVW